MENIQTAAPPAFHVMTKPRGAICNLDCTYCYYLRKENLYPGSDFRMSDAVLESYVRQYIESQRAPEVTFAWQGGEPTLMGLGFYRQVVELQKKHGAPGQEVGNSLQTNGILLDDDWCRFLHENKFLVGISIDGPKELHDHYRLDLGGRGTFDRVVPAIECCKKYDVEFNTLTLVNNLTADHPDEVFDSLVDLGVRYLQFIPCVEADPQTGQVAEFSVSPEQYGQFLCRVFDRWMKFGPDKLSIRDFDSILSYCIEGRHSICTFDRQCSQYIVIEHTGDVFPCDFFVDSQWRLGNILDTPMEELAACPAKRAFARKKQNLCNKCLVCRHLALCRGGCMKDRTPFEKEGRGRESYFCESYRQFFDYAKPRFMQTAAQVRSGALVRPERLV